MLNRIRNIINGYLQNKTETTRKEEEHDRRMEMKHGHRPDRTETHIQIKEMTSNQLIHSILVMLWITPIIILVFITTIIVRLITDTNPGEWVDAYIKLREYMELKSK